MYDALTNPLMIFDYKFYIENILSTFTKVEFPAATMKMIITKELSENYDKHLPFIVEKFTELLKSSEQDAKLILKDHAFAFNLARNKIPRDQMEVTYAPSGQNCASIN